MKQIRLEMKSGAKTLKSWNLDYNKFFIKSRNKILKFFFSREYTIGRHPDCNIFIDHSSLSRNHAKISVSPNGSAMIQDLNSSNREKFLIINEL